MLSKKRGLKIKDFFHHETKKHSLVKFIGLLTIVISYFVYVSMKLGTKEGLFVTILTWSFFIFCTPIADAGFILAFPIRLLMGTRMMYTQIASFFVALFINLYAFFLTPKAYESTIILKLFYQIISHPFPYWGIILLSILGTILSIYFGDELIDVSTHKERKKFRKHMTKYQIIISIFLIAATIILYDFLLKNLGINIPL